MTRRCATGAGGVSRRWRPSAPTEAAAPRVEAGQVTLLVLGFSVVAILLVWARWR